jgi:two-component sensor histidine kinase
LNELLSNAFKHAFPGDAQGTIHVRLCQENDGEIVLEVADDGVGLPAGFDLGQSGTLGMLIIRSLGKRQLGGQVTFRVDGGVTCQVRFRDDVKIQEYEG